MKKMPSSPLYEYSKRAVESYIQTVVYIDDQKRRSDLIESESDKTEFEQVVSVFAEKNIICSMVNPDNFQQQLVESKPINDICKTTDVLILDWDINDDQGKQSCEFISKIVEESLENDPHQLRLMIVYTQEPNLKDVFDDLTEKLRPDNGKLNNYMENENCLVVQVDTCRIVVIGKYTNTEDSDRKFVKVNELPDKIVEEFMKLAPGLLSSNVLFGMSTIKRNAQRILAKFSHEIDPAFLTHFLLSEPSEHAIEQITSLIVSEIESILFEESPTSQLSEEIITSWVESVWKPGEHVPEKYKTDNKKFVIENVQKKLQIDSEENTKEIVKYLDKNMDLFHGNEKNTSNLRFSNLLSCRTFYENKEKSLTLGTIIKDNKNRYLLCLQPKCDCIRLEGRTKFLFIELKDKTDAKREQKGDKANHDKKSYKANHIIIVSEDNEEYKELYFSPKTELCELIEFTPHSGEKEIKTKENTNNFQVDNSQNGKRFTWVAQLKSEHSQRIAENFGSEISRVGLSESEWSRRKVGKMKKVY